MRKKTESIEYKLEYELVNESSRNKQPKLFTLDVCKKCANKCKIKAIKNAELMYCPDINTQN